MTRFLVFLAALFIAGAASASDYFVNAPRDGFLNLRTGPSTYNHVLRQMPHGSRVTVLSAPGSWWKIRHASGAVGWASSRYLTQHEARRDDHRRPDAAPGHRQQYVTAPGYSGLNMRTGPGTGYGVVIKMNQGSRVTVLAGRGTWLLVQHESGRTGWAHSKFLSNQRPERVHTRPLPYVVPHQSNRRAPDIRPDRGHGRDHAANRCDHFYGRAYANCINGGVEQSYRDRERDRDQGRSQDQDRRQGHQGYRSY